MRRWLSTLAALAAVLWTAPHARAEAGVDAARLEPFFATLSPCQLFHLTDDGYLRIIPSQHLTRTWDRGVVGEMARAARLRPSFPLSLRSTVHLQAASASSYQASTAYRALGAFMAAEKIDAVSRTGLIAAAAAAYRKTLADQGLEACFIVKWGNRYPDLVAQPMRRESWAAIRALFEGGALEEFPLTAVESEALAAGRLTQAEIVELRAIRIAAYLFENEFAVLKNDRGGFNGNLEDQPFVCTDEATTQWFFLDRLQRAGLMRAFSTQDGRFVHRRPTLVLPSDHFGVLLKNQRTGEYFVLDSWVEDGGLPPHISDIEDWHDLHERRSVASIGDPALDAALGAGLVTHEDADGLLTRLRSHLARFAPRDQSPRPDGRPPTCSYQWCGAAPSPALLEAW